MRTSSCSLFFFSPTCLSLRTHMDKHTSSLMNTSNNNRKLSTTTRNNNNSNNNTVHGWAQRKMVPKTIGEQSKEAFPYAQHQYLKKQYRQSNLLNELRHLDADVLCLQEVDSYEHWEKQLNDSGYSGLYQLKGGKHQDGVALFYKREKFAVVRSLCVDFDSLAEELSHDHLLTNSAGIFAHLKLRSHPTASLCVATAHIAFRPSKPETNTATGRMMLREIERFAAAASTSKSPTATTTAATTPPIIICGDFNAMPSTALYQLIADGIVDIDHPDLSTTVYPERLKQFLTQPFVTTPSSPSRSPSSSPQNTRRAAAAVTTAPTTTTATTRLHPYHLASAYSLTGNKEGEPEFTNVRETWRGTLDYIFFEPTRLSLRAILEIPSVEEVCTEVALPNSAYSSDHVALKAEFSFR